MREEEGDDDVDHDALQPTQVSRYFHGSRSICKLCH